MPGLHNNLAVVQLSKDDQRSAISSFRRAMQLDSDYEIGAANLGSLFVEYKDFKRAVDLLNEGYSAVRKDLRRGVAVDVANNYALALSGTGETKKAG